MRVNAYAAPAAGQPLAPTTIERRDVGPNDVLIEIQYAGICHSDIHTVNGDWGPQPFPVVPGPRDRRRRRRGRLRRHPPPGRRPRRRRLHGQLLRRVHQLPQRRRAVLPRRHGPAPTPAPTATGPSPRAATPPTSSSTPTSSSPSPTGIDAGRRRAAAVRRHHHLLPAAPLGRRPRQEGRRRRPRRAGPHGRQARPRDGRRGHRALAVAEEAGGRAAARGRPLLRDLRPGHLRAACRPVRPDHQHRQRQHRRRRLPGAARRRRHPGQRRRPCRAAEPQRVLAASAAAGPSPGR